MIADNLVKALYATTNNPSSDYFETIVQCVCTYPNIKIQKTLFCRDVKTLIANVNPCGCVIDLK